MYVIKQSTGLTIPFFAHDANGDGVTGLVDGGFTKRISKGSGAFAAMTVTITEMENGWYSFPLSSSHSDTLGLLSISFSHANTKRVNLQWRVEARTLDDLATPTNITAGTITTATNVTTVNGLAANVITAASIATGAIDADALATDAVDEIADGVWDEVLTAGTHNVGSSAGKRLRQIDAAFEVWSGTAQAGGASSITLDAGASATDNIYNGDRVVIVAGTGAQEHGIIIAYNGTTKVATMSKAWVTTPDATSEFEIVPADVDVETWNNTAATGDGDWAELQTDVDAILVDTAEIGAAGAGLTNINLPNQTMDIVGNITGNLSGSVGSVTGLTAATVHSDLDDIQARLPAALTGAGNMKADVLALNGDATAAATLAILNGANVVYRGTVTGAATTTTLVDSGLTQADTDWWIGRIIIFTSVITLQATDITGFTPATDTLTFTAVTQAPTGATYVII